MDVLDSPAPRRSQADRTATTRHALVEAATELLAEQGYGSATTAAIAERSNLTTGALHHHFGTKEDLLFAVLDATNERILDQLSRVSTRTDLPGVADRLVRQLWNAYGDHRYWAVWEIILGQRHDPALLRRLVAHRASSVDRLFNAAMDGAGIPGPARPALRDSFSFTLHTIRGLLLDRLLKPDPTTLRRQLDLLSGMLDAAIRAAMTKTELDRTHPQNRTHPQRGPLE